MLFTFPSRYWYTIGLPGVFSLTRWSWLIHTGFPVPRATQDTARVEKSLRLQDFHLLWSTFPVLFDFRSYNPIWQSYYPSDAETSLVWAVPLSIATTQGITLVFSSSGYLDVSVRRVCFPSKRNNQPSADRVAPFGNLRIISYLHLPVAYRSLSRPSSPPGA